MTNSLDTETQESPVDAVVSEDGDQDNAHEKAFDNATVQKIVARERMKAYEKGKQEALMQFEQSAQPQQQPAPEQAQQQAPAQQAPSSLGGMQQMSPDDIQRLIAEQMPQHLQNHINEMQTRQQVDSFVNKMQAAESRHPGIEAKLNELDYTTLSPVIRLANDMENTADIMAELLEHPMKMGNITTLMYTQPKLAQKAMQDLSNSIKQNQAALQSHESVNQPIGQMKPSANAGIDNGEMSVSDYRKMFKA